MDPIAGPVVITGGSISLVTILGVLLKRWLDNQDREAAKRYAAQEKEAADRHAATVEQLATVSRAMKNIVGHLSSQHTRITVLEKSSVRAEDIDADHEERLRAIERADRTPSGRFRVPIKLGDDEG